VDVEKAVSNFSSVISPLLMLKTVMKYIKKYKK
jgi:hypothetical protein